MDSAVRIAVEKLAEVDLNERTQMLDLPNPDNGRLRLRVFNKDIILDTQDFGLVSADDRQPAKTAELILLLHYLLCDFPVKATGELIPFRDFPGGQFYLDPFLSRTVKPLLNRFGSDISSLRKNLDRFVWQPVEIGDLGARINAFGNLDITLIYRSGDDEFPASADVLFDSCVKRVYRAEDAAVMASRICIGLL